MSEITAALRDMVVERAGNRCEYCGLAQDGQEAIFHIDHVQPRASGGPSTIENLALACVSCSLRKGARETTLDPSTNTSVRLFNPRNDDWSKHFRWDGPILVPLTDIGRGTASALAMNRPLIVAIRKEEMILGRHPS